MNVLMNTGWWTQALVDHRKLDVEEHSGDRTHQKRDPDALALHTPDHELTAWERGWITARINDAHVLHLEQRAKAQAILAEPVEEHEARELAAGAQSYFGASHDNTRRGFEELRAKHQKQHDVAHTLKHRPDPDGPLTPIPPEAVADIRAQHAQAIAQIDDYLATGTGLIDRHIATVKAEVADKRRIAQKHVDDCERLLAVSHSEHVAREHARVQGDLRSAAQEEP